MLAMNIYEKSDLLNLIYNLKSHLIENPCNKVKLFTMQKERKIGNIDDSNQDLHKKSKQYLKELIDKLKRDELQIANYGRSKFQTFNQGTLDIVNKNVEKISHIYKNKIKDLNIIVESQKGELVMTKQTLKEFKNIINEQIIQQKKQHNQQKILTKYYFQDNHGNLFILLIIERI
ncbi:unnamed protein product [Paramecium sonneborni]|uniref:Uncharacterized protein n=1 Tax=Paramecium sonneborni TaxID=65129 RepID=A0A8S1RNF8_9CILI|nr:unnamed protein product [Paramecium sonneborni]